jgi:hypothetical protein
MSVWFKQSKAPRDLEKTFLHLYSIGHKLKMLGTERGLKLARLGAETGYCTLGRHPSISMAVLHIYRIVSCKTCDSPIDVEYLGPTVNVRIAGTIFNPGQIRCPKCGESHKYTGSDIKLWIKGHPPYRTR